MTRRRGRNSRTWFDKLDERDHRVEACGKIAHATRARAKTVAKKMARAKGEVREAYLCQRCAGYHVAHASVAAREARRRTTIPFAGETP